MALRKRKACLDNSQLSREELRKTDQVHENMALRQFLINKINISESRQKAWEKWLEMRELLEDGIQLLRGLETWKVLVAERLSSFPLRVFKAQTILPDTTTLEGREKMKKIILKVIENFELNWNAFKNTSTTFLPSLSVPLTLPLQNCSPNQVSTSHFPQRFAASQVLPQSQPQAFPTPNPSLSNFFSQQPVLWNNPMQHVQHQATAFVPPFSAHLSHPNHAPFGNNAHMSPNMTRYTPYKLPLPFNQNSNVQNMQAPNAPTHWNTPFKFPPMNSIVQLPVLKPIQNLEPSSSKPDEKAEPTDDEEVDVENVENGRNSPFINVVD